MITRSSGAVGVPVLVVSLAALASPAFGQSTPPTVTLPTVVVTAQKEPRDLQETPASVTAVSGETVDAAGIRTVSEAGVYAPNVWFTDFSARKLSNARVRGIGSSPLNPAVTTYIDGVPQLNANSSNVELVDVDQIEFVRGPQSPLFGRNALGGVINVLSSRPSLSSWTGSFVAPFGNFGAKEGRGSISGPINDTLAVGLSLGRQVRDGYATNTVTGNTLDTREATFGKAQAMWVPSQNWEARLVVSGERDRDGDYMLADLNQARQAPFQVTRDFEGHTRRDITSTSVQVRGEGERVTFTSTTGVVSWNTDDATDLDYSPLPLATRSNREASLQFTQEVRLASPANTPARLTDALALGWQSGLVLFTQRYDQTAVNTIAPFVFSPFIGFPVRQTSPAAALDDVGIGVFGQGTFTVHDAWDFTLGLRIDHERKDADLRTAFQPAIAPAVMVTTDRQYSNLSPQFAAGYRASPTVMAYASASQGFKAGGFNPASPSGAESYDVERAWHIEGGVKTTLAGGRATANMAVFAISWDDLQLNVPSQQVPGQFFVANVGRANSRGVEIEVVARPHAHVDVFASAGYTRARFADGSISSGGDVAGNTIPNTPDYTATVGAQVQRPVGRDVSVYGRAEATFYGAFQYDDLNTQGQDAYSLAHFRAGMRRQGVSVEAWVRNAFDTRYIPVAFQYDFAPSGFIGEVGRPRTFGVSVGVGF